MRKQLLAAVGGGSVLAGGWLVRRYRHDVAAARARRAAIDRTVIETSSTAGDGAAVTLQPAVVARMSRDLMVRLLLTKPRRAGPAQVRLPGRQCLVA